MSSTSHSPSPSPLVEPDAPSLSQNPYVHQGQDDSYSPFIQQDLNNRVFVDFEVFMKHVLHVPDDWKDAWGPTIEAVKADSDFEKHYGEYRKLCEDFGTHEELPHKTLVNTAKAAFDVLSRSTNISPQTPGGAVRQEALHRQRETITVHILGVNPYYGVLCDGTSMPRLLVSGEYATDLSMLGRS